MAIKEDVYKRTASSMYKMLLGRKAYGHHCEQISYIAARLASENPISKTDAIQIINKEIEKGYLRLDKSGNAISIPLDKKKLKEISKKYELGKVGKEKASELIKRGTLPGVR